MKPPTPLHRPPRRRRRRAARRPRRTDRRQVRGSELSAFRTACRARRPRGGQREYRHRRAEAAEEFRRATLSSCAGTAATPGGHARLLRPAFLLRHSLRRTRPRPAARARVRRRAAAIDRPMLRGQFDSAVGTRDGAGVRKRVPDKDGHAISRPCSRGHAPARSNASGIVWPSSRSRGTSIVRRVGAGAVGLMQVMTFWPSPSPAAPPDRQDAREPPQGCASATTSSARRTSARALETTTSQVGKRWYPTR